MGEQQWAGLSKWIKRLLRAIRFITGPLFPAVFSAINNPRRALLTRQDINSIALEGKKGR